MSILARIHANGGEVIRNEWRIAIRRGRLTDSALAWITEHRAELMREVWPEWETFEERAAIREYCGGMVRHDAERAAYGEVLGC